MKFSDCTDMRSFILREARLDVLNPERSEFSRAIKAIVDASMRKLAERDETLAREAMSRYGCAPQDLVMVRSAGHPFEPPTFKVATDDEP